jgi:hypothetical protein
VRQHDCRKLAPDTGRTTVAAAFVAGVTLRLAGNVGSDPPKEGTGGAGGRQMLVQVPE